MGRRKRQGPKQSGPGQHYRKGISLMELFDQFPPTRRPSSGSSRPGGPAACGAPIATPTNIQERPTRKPQPYRCRTCRKDFSVKTGSVMQGINLGFRVWVVAVYLVATGLTGTSSMKLYRLTFSASG